MLMGSNPNTSAPRRTSEWSAELPIKPKPMMATSQLRMAIVFLQRCRSSRGGPVAGDAVAGDSGPSQSSFLALRVDGLAAIEHRDESLDLLLPTGFGFHIVSAKGQREPVLRTEFRQHCLCLGLGIDRRLEIAGDLHVLAAVIGARPASVGLGLIDLFQPVSGHPAFVDQPCNVIDVDPAPDAFLLARRVALEIAVVVETLAEAIDPTPAKYHVDGLLRSDRFEPRIHFVDLDPDLVFLEVVFAEPLIETLRVLERADFIGIDFGGCHQQTLKAARQTGNCGITPTRHIRKSYP